MKELVKENHMAVFQYKMIISHILQISYMNVTLLKDY